MKFKKEDLQEIVWRRGYEIDGKPVTIVSKEIEDTSRWSVVHSHIFGWDGRFWYTSYSVGATEQQDESPYEYEEDEIECTQVFKVKRITVDYVTAEHADTLRLAGELAT